MDPEPLLDPTDDTLWHLVSTRSPLGTGKFLYAVKTTRIFCRPTCKARLARRSNVIFFRTAAEAQGAGFRPCKRCKPDLAVEVFEPEAEKIRNVCETLRELIGRGEKVPGLGDMASLAGLTKFHFHRLFKRETGLTPKEFAMSLQRKRREGGVNDLWASTYLTSSPSLSSPDPASNSTPSLAKGLLTPLTPSTLPNESIDMTLVPGIYFSEDLEQRKELEGEDLTYFVQNLDKPSPGVDMANSILYYSIREIASEKLLVALQDDQICWIDVGSDGITLMQRFELSYSSACYTQLPLDWDESTEGAMMRARIDEFVTELETLFSFGDDVSKDWLEGSDWLSVG